MTEIHLFGNYASLPDGISLAKLGFIPTPTNTDNLHAYFHETELQGRNVAIVYQDPQDEDAAGEIYSCMENFDASVEPYCGSKGALAHFYEKLPDILIVSAALPDLHDFLKVCREMEK